MARTVVCRLYKVGSVWQDHLRLGSKFETFGRRVGASPGQRHLLATRTQDELPYHKKTPQKGDGRKPSGLSTYQPSGSKGY